MRIAVTVLQLACALMLFGFSAWYLMGGCR